MKVLVGKPGEGSRRAFSVVVKLCECSFTALDEKGPGTQVER